MYISYGLGVLIMAPIAPPFWALTGWWITKVIIWAIVLWLAFFLGSEKGMGTLAKRAAVAGAP